MCPILYLAHYELLNSVVLEQLLPRVRRGRLTPVSLQEPR